MKNFLLSFLFLLVSCTALSQKQGQALVDSLLKELPKVKEDTNKVTLLDGISYAYYVIDPDKGIKYGEMELNLAGELNWQKGTVMAITSLGTNYYAKGDFSSALQHYFKAIEINQQINDLHSIATLQMNIGTIYQKQGKYPEALDNCLKALKIHEKLGDKTNTAIANFTIGNIYLEQEQYDDALIYFSLSLKIFETQGNKSGAATVYGNIGNVFYLQRNNREALVYFDTALQIHRETGNKAGIAMMTGNMGAIKVTLQQYEDGLKYFFESQKAYSELGDKAGILTTCTGIGETYYLVVADTVAKHNLKSLGKAACLKNANEYLKKAVALSRETGSLNYLQQSLNRLSEAQQLSGNYKDALKSYQEYIAIKDSIFSKENTRKSVQLQAQYDFDKKEAAIKAGNEKREIIGISTGVAIFIISFVSVLFYRKRENDKFKLQLVAVRQEALNAQMSDHFIGNTMDSINNFMKDNNKEKASEYLILFSRLIRKVLENASERMIPLQDDLSILKDYLELEKLRFQNGSLQYDIIVDEAIDKSKMLIPPMVFQTLAENSLKHGLKRTTGGSLLFKISKDKNIVECSVKDNGVGRKGSVHYKDSTSHERVSFGSSIAEKLVKSVSKYGRQTSYKIIDLFDAANNPSGTLVRFTIPYMLAD